MAFWDERSRARFAESSVDKKLGLERSERVHWGVPTSCPLPGLSLGTKYRKEGMQARFSIRWILFCRKKPRSGNQAEVSWVGDL